MRTLFVGKWKDDEINHILEFNKLPKAEKTDKLTIEQVLYHDGPFILDNAEEYRKISDLSPDKRCYVKDKMGPNIKILSTDMIILNFIMGKEPVKIPNAAIKDLKYVVTLWYDSQVKDYSSLFNRYLQDGIVLRDMHHDPLFLNLEEKGYLNEDVFRVVRQNILASAIFSTSLTKSAFVDDGTYVPSEKLSGNIGFKILMDKCVPKFNFFAFGQENPDITLEILDRGKEYIKNALRSGLASQVTNFKKLVYITAISDILSRQVVKLRINENDEFC